jgi:malonyl-CoA O-methyltransferase
MTRSDQVDVQYELDRALVRKSFDEASRTYDAAAVLQNEVRSRLHARLDLVRLEPSIVVDMGCGTGRGARDLKDRYRSAQVLGIDLAFGMLRAARERRRLLRRFAVTCADAMRLPMPGQSVDLVVSNLMLQWCDPPDAVFEEVARVLRPGGLFMFTTFGPDTLRELRGAWASVDGYTHVNRFIDMHDLGDGLIRSGLAEPVMDVEYFTLTYPTVRGLMRDLKAIGAHNVTRGRAQGLTGRRRLEAMEAAYERARRGGHLPATYEVVYGQAWTPANLAPRATQSGEVRIPLRDIARRRSE